MYVRYFVIAFLSLGTAKSAAPSEVTLSTSVAMCLAENIESYLSIDTDPVIFVGDQCPSTFISENDLLNAAENSSSRVLAPRVGDGIGIYVLMKSELSCFQHEKARNLDTSKGDHVRLRFESCVFEQINAME